MPIIPSPLFTYQVFRGIANNVDTRRIPKDYQSIAINIDIDDEGRLIRRLGIGDPIIPGPCHSLWSNGKICLFCQDGKLKRLTDTWTEEVVLDNIGDGTLTYAYDGARRVYFSSTTDYRIVGYIEDGIAYSFPEPEQTFKERMVGGHLLEYYNSRLYAARDNIIIFSDAVAPMRYDSRKNYKQFPGFITMMSAVADGMYISAGDKIFFMAGADPQEATLVLISNTPAILNSAIKVEGEEVGRGLTGSVVIWLSSDGVFIGGADGVVKQLTRYYSAEGFKRGHAVYRSDRGFDQYLCVLEYQPGMGAGEGYIDLPCPEINAYGLS